MSILLNIREIQIKTTMRYHLTPVRMTIVKHSTKNQGWRGCGEMRTLLHRCWNANWEQPLWTVCTHAKSFQSCLALFDPMNCNLPGSSLHGILQARNTGVGCLQGIFPTQGSNARLFPVLAGGFFTTSATWEAHGNSVEVP